jgi:antitoxin component YwqK of YwqJK toxin-antitoxin module
MSAKNSSLAPVNVSAEVLLVAALLTLQGCSKELDARQVHVEQGLIYKKDASDPFTGTLTNVGPNQVGREYGAQFLPFEGNCSVLVRDGLFDGTANCKNAKGKKVAEVTYSQGHQNGALKVWAPDTDNLMLSMTVRGSIVDGVTERFNPKTGKIISRVAYSAGQKSGEEKLWDITGDTLLTDLNWKNGTKTGVYRYGAKEEHYKAGVRDGLWKTCQLNNSISRERFQANYHKAEAYDAMAERLGGTYFLPALVDSPSSVECTEVIYKDGIEQITTAASAGVSTSVDACLDAKVTAFHKEHGNDAPIIHDLIEEWQATCRK